MWHWSEVLKESHHCSFASTPPGQSADGCYHPFVDPSPAQPILKLCWPGVIGLLHSTYKLPPVGPLPGSQPQPAPSLGQAFRGRQQTSAHTGYPCMACTLQGRLLLAGHLCQPKLQCLLGILLGSAGARRMVSGLVVICDF